MTTPTVTGIGLASIRLRGIRNTTILQLIHAEESGYRPKIDVPRANILTFVKLYKSIERAFPGLPECRGQTAEQEWYMTEPSWGGPQATAASKYWPLMNESESRRREKRNPHHVYRGVGPKTTQVFGLDPAKFPKFKWGSDFHFIDEDEMVPIEGGRSFWLKKKPSEEGVISQNNIFRNWASEPPCKYPVDAICSAMINLSSFSCFF